MPEEIAEVVPPIDEDAKVKDINDRLRDLPEGTIPTKPLGKVALKIGPRYDNEAIHSD
jgi:hypothetical protein